MKKQPEVTAQTRKKLMDAFWDIYYEKGMQHTTVGAITKSAGYNRGTFYEYFTDIYDLLGQLEDDLLEDLTLQINEIFEDGFPKDFREFSNACAHVFSLFGDKLYTLMGSQGDPAFPLKLQKKLRPIMLSFTGISKEDPYLDYLTAFGFSAMMGVVGHWYESGKKLEIEKLFQLIQTLVATGVMGYTKREVLTLNAL